MTADRCPTTGKLRHPSPQHAHRAVSHEGRRERGRGAKARPQAGSAYQCPDCRSWHVRTPTRRPRR